MFGHGLAWPLVIVRYWLNTIDWYNWSIALFKSLQQTVSSRSRHGLCCHLCHLHRRVQEFLPVLLAGNEKRGDLKGRTIVRKAQKLANASLGSYGWPVGQSASSAKGGWAQVVL